MKRSNTSSAVKASLWKIICAWLAIMIALSGFVLPVNAEDIAGGSSASPVIRMKYVPKYGEFTAFTGYVYMEDGSNFNTEDYKITMYLQISEGEQYWVKPTEKDPCTDLNETGFFSFLYTTGSNDQNATVMHILLIPSDYKPSLNGFSAARAAALDYVKITRSTDGSVIVEPDRSTPSPAPDEDVKVKKVSKLKVSKKKLAVDVGLYITGAPGGKLSKKTIKKQLKAVKKYSNTVRFYGSAGQLTKAYRIAHDMGLRVIGSAYLCGDAAADKKEMDALIKVCRKGYVSVACVGNETLLNNTLTEDELIADIDYVKNGLSEDKVGKKIPVTTSDDSNAMIANKRVAEKCDLLMVNSYPYWGGVSISDAAAAFDTTIGEVRSAYPTKEIIVSETGWPTSGGSNGAAKASGTNARKYFNEIRKWSLKNDIVVLWFDAADEPWKASYEGKVGAHWGLMTKNCKLKSCYKKTAFFKSK